MSLAFWWYAEASWSFAVVVLGEDVEPAGVPRVDGMGQGDGRDHPRDLQRLPRESQGDPKSAKN